MAAHCLIYALGGGLGHLQRAGALVAALARRGAGATVLSNSPLLTPAWREARPWLEDLSGMRSTAALRRAVRERIATAAAERLVVDSFPRGLLGELDDLPALFPGPRALIRRRLAPAYRDRPAVRAACAAYHLHLLPGEGTAGACTTVLRTGLWLACDAAECLPPDLARRRLGCPDDGLPAVALPASGTRAEMVRQRDLHGLLARALAGEAHPRLLEPRMRRPPLLRLLPGVAAVVGAGGYNTVAECRATGTPLLARPRPRRYDVQSERLRPEERWRTPDDLLRRLRPSLVGPRPPFRRYRNGAHAAAAALLALRGA